MALPTPAWKKRLKVVKEERKKLPELKLNIKYSILKEKGVKLEEEAEYFAGTFTLGLDYSEGGLERLDRYLNQFNTLQSGRPIRAHLLHIPLDKNREVSTAVLGAGCFLGEFIIKKLGGRWKRDKKVPYIKLNNSKFAYPFKIVEKKVRYPRKISILEYYQDLKSKR